VRDGGPMTPFVITERSGERSLVRFVAETLEASIAEAVASIRADPVAQADRSMLVYDGFLTMPDGDRFDAIFAEVVEAGGLVTCMAQRYKPKGRLRRFETVGNAALLPVGQGKL
jgi:NADPH:quinone reductase-like Zn-dependent oxidoreductase